MDNLFAGLDNFDNEKITSALQSPFIQNLDNETTKLVRELLKKYQPKVKTGSNDVTTQEEDDEAGVML